MGLFSKRNTPESKIGCCDTSWSGDPEWTYRMYSAHRREVHGESVEPEGHAGHAERREPERRPEYQVVVSDDAQHMRLAMEKDWLRHGWKPLGGPFVKGDYWYQTVTRNVEKGGC